MNLITIYMNKIHMYNIYKKYLYISRYAYIYIYAMHTRESDQI